VPVFPAIGLGCASLGKPQVSDAEAVGTMLAALEGGIAYLDTAPLYGCGLSERRVGAALRRWQGPRPLVSTKAGYVIDGPEGGYLPVDRRRHDFSRTAIRAGFSASLDRLGLDRVDLVSLHDPVGQIEAAAEGFAALAELRDEGLVSAIGIGTNSAETAVELLTRCPLDAVLIAGRFSLLDRRAGVVLLPLCAGRGVQVIVGGVFNSGLLAAPEAEAATFEYAPASVALVGKAREMAAAAGRHGVSLRTAALQFAGRHMGVGTTLIGPASRAELAENLVDLAAPVPQALWAQLDTLAARDAL